MSNLFTRLALGLTLDGSRSRQHSTLSTTAPALWSLSSKPLTHPPPTSIILRLSKTSIVRQLYEPYARPLAGVVRGLPTSWEPTKAIMLTSRAVVAIAWSPCSKFVALAHREPAVIEILDAITLGRIKTFPSTDTAELQPHGLPAEPRYLHRYQRMRCSSVP